MGPAVPPVLAQEPVQKIEQNDGGGAEKPEDALSDDAPNVKPKDDDPAADTVAEQPNASDDVNSMRSNRAETASEDVSDNSEEHSPDQDVDRSGPERQTDGKSETDAAARQPDTEEESAATSVEGAGTAATGADRPDDIRAGQPSAPEEISVSKPASRPDLTDLTPGKPVQDSDRSDTAARDTSIVGGASTSDEVAETIAARQEEVEAATLPHAASPPVAADSSNQPEEITTTSMEVAGSDQPTGLPPAPQLSTPPSRQPDPVLSAPASTVPPPVHHGDATLPEEPQATAIQNTPSVDPELEAALGDMFATPAQPIDHRAPLGVPGHALGSAVPDRRPTNHGDIFPNQPEIATQPEISPDPGGTQSDLQVSAPAFPSPDAEFFPTEDRGDIYPHAAGNAQFQTDPGFSAPNDIAPDPTLERSHIDTRTDAPFATDFTDDLSPTVPGERRGQHVHEHLQRRRAAVNLGWFCLALIVGSIIGIVTLARDSVVRALPGSATIYAALGSPVNIRGLDFSDVSYGWTTDQGRPAIDVKGTIKNVSDVAMDVPTVVFVLLDDRGDELYNWASRVREEPIEAGGEASFEARVPAPPGAARRLRVRFARKSR